MLKYLFTARFSDGTVLEQTPGDLSRLEPTTRNAFYDVLNHPAELLDFTLTDGTNTYGINILTGTFTINSGSLSLHDVPLNNPRLIYYRSNTIQFDQNNQELSRDVVYVLGFQANDEKGNNIQHTIKFT